MTTANRAWETSATTGSGSLTLDGAVAGYTTLNTGVGTLVEITYWIESDSNQWETGKGQLSDATTLVRTTIQDNSEGTLVAIVFTGTLQVFIAPNATELILPFQDMSRHHFILGQLAGAAIDPAVTWRNFAIGELALNRGALVAGADDNMAIGYYTMFSDVLTTGTDNTAIGSYALSDYRFNHSRCTAVGRSAASDTWADDVTAVGYRALYRASPGTGCTAVGSQAADGASSGINWSFVGSNAGHNDNGAGEGRADNNTGFGTNAMRYWASTSGSTHADNVAIGAHSMCKDGVGNSLSTAIGNVAVGTHSLTNMFIGASYNTAIGQKAGYSISDADFNTYVGAFSGELATSSQNTGIGYAAIQGASGTGNCALGYRAGQATTSSNGIFIGNAAAFNYGVSGTSGGNNIIIGAYGGWTVHDDTTKAIVLGPDVGPATSTDISNELWIHHSKDDAPLLHGHFTNRTLHINGALSATNFVATNYSKKTTTYTAVRGDYIFADTTSGAFTITLPITPAIGDTVTIHDDQGNFATAGLTVDRNGETIMGAAANEFLGTADSLSVFIYTGSDWRVS
jgi:hypothetical protein